MSQQRKSGSQKKTGGRKPKGVVARTTQAAEKIHRAVAGFPLDLLEQIGRLKKPVARVRKLQDRSITAIYDVVRGVDQEVGRLLREPTGKRASASRARARAPVHHAKPAATRSHPPVRAAAAS